MRVTGKTGSTGVTSARATGGSAPAGGAAPASATGGPSQVGDALSVSSTAHFIAVARAQIDSIPDIRHAKVDAIRSQLDRDAYHPDGEAVAEGLVNEHLSRTKKG